MRFFTAVAAFGLVALASAQSSTNGTEVTSTSQSAPASTSLTAQARCLNACGDDDICCKARCVGVPCPNDLAANQTTDCASQCVQGNGTEEETSSYAACQQSCISSLFFPLSTTAGGAAATGTGASGATTTGSAEGTGIGGTASGDSTVTETGAAASSTSDSDNGAGRNTIAGAGLLGLVIAGLAL